MARVKGIKVIYVYEGNSSATIQEIFLSSSTNQVYHSLSCFAFHVID